MLNKVKVAIIATVIAVVAVVLVVMSAQIEGHAIMQDDLALDQAISRLEK